MVENKDSNIKFNISFQQEKISNIVNKINEEIKKIEHTEQDLDFKVEMAAREMLANAIEHGCQHERDKIRVKLEITCSKVILTVIDPGPGFDWENKDFSLPLMEEKGRGLGMIDKVADDIEFNEAGNIITVYFYI